MGDAMGESEQTPRRSAKRTRCAIYTRKSSEEGLEQAFNSLDAQREACTAFIASQKHEGWTVLPTLYDDGGFSGGTMQRPALKRLIADIEAGQIDVIVVYKVDRLTRALADFAKLVEVFDRRGVSFVSITQQFNTTTSMGRLTLNVLLSFAQFEREVTGERIRDKVAASKKKGMWMGGMPPLGYDVKNRKLVVNEAEARIVIEIYRRYLARFRCAAGFAYGLTIRPGSWPSKCWMASAAAFLKRFYRSSSPISWAGPAITASLAAWSALYPWGDRIESTVANFWVQITLAILIFRTIIGTVLILIRATRRR